MKLLALILASGFATSLVGCATDSASSPNQEDMLLGTWMGNFHAKPTLFAFNDDGSVSQTDEMSNARQVGTYAFVDGELTLDFGSAQEFHVTVSNDAVTFVESHETLQRLSSCGAAPIAD